MIDHQPVRAAAIVGPPGVAVLGRFHADEAALGRRDADTAQTVAAMRHRHHAGGDRGRRPAGRAAGTMRGIPGIAANTEMASLRCSGDAEFGRVGFAQQNDAGLPVTPRQLRIMLRDVIAQIRRAVRHRPAGDRQADILDQKRHAPEGAVRQFSRGRFPRFVKRPVDDGVQLQIVTFDAGDCCVYELKRRHFAAAHEMGEARRVVTVIFGETHRLQSLNVGWRAAQGDAISSCRASCSRVASSP